jgi:hypothetical protein
MWIRFYFLAKKEHKNTSLSQLAASSLVTTLALLHATYYEGEKRSDSLHAHNSMAWPALLLAS